MQRDRCEREVAEDNLPHILIVGLGLVLRARKPQEVPSDLTSLQIYPYQLADDSLGRVPDMDIGESPKCRRIQVLLLWDITMAQAPADRCDLAQRSRHGDM